MGNSQCVPQAPRRLRASFSRKPSIKSTREDGSRKLASLFGNEAGPDGDTAADKILYYIPGMDIPGLEGQREALDQPLLSVFKKGRRKVPVRNLGKVLYYAKVQLRFQHSQDTSDCYLELFPSHLYFQAHGSDGLTFQGLLPLTELSVCPVEGSAEHAFQITGPLPAPLLVLCPSTTERTRWLYHLEKQMALAGGLRRCHSAPPQLTQLRVVSGQESGGNAICASRVKLQHLPSQELCDRLLVLYPTSLAIFSEEPDGLSFKGELPISAIHINLEEKGKQIRSFLIEGRFINSIRVVCASYEDYGHWVLCLRTAVLRDRGSALPGGASHPAHPLNVQVVGGGRGSLSSDGRTSWGSGCPAPPSTRTSHSLPESTLPPPAVCQVQPGADKADPGYASISRRRSELRRGGSSRSPKNKAKGGPATPLHLDLDLTKLSRLSLEGGPDDPLEPPHSPLYADPYTPPATSHHKITDVRGLDEFLSAMHSASGPEPASVFPAVPVSVPISDPSPPGPSSPPGPHLLSKKGVLQARAPQRLQGSFKGRGPRPPDSPQLVSTSREGSPVSQPPPPAGCSPRRRAGPSYNSAWDEAAASSRQKWPRSGAPEAEGALTQWI
ncbi:PREDICTED: pleckstrin homology domain-containing family N member 1 [Chrysochloris asiatica]|uniref:Pleckstrin homology domain-containing family N member 1 n=1 Tax=Chrysochloris asiatica TaxID=185453 RepID=A0A9B0WVP1_CHRAS|nr:PREDICTED: pleckstrin homology domain-containing family N member 1 [Chrysochloris asiatica]